MTWIKIFKSGTHTDSRGNTREWTEEELQQRVELYNNQPEAERHDASLRKGHKLPDSGEPALGYIEQLKLVGQEVFAKVMDVAEDLKQDVQARKYGKVSAGWRADGLLDHVAVLGAENPAIKGLGMLQFSELAEDLIAIGEANEFSFYDTIDQSNPEDINKELESIKSVVNSLSDTVSRLSTIVVRWRDQMIADKGLEEANKIFDAWDLKWLIIDSSNKYLFTDKSNGGQMADNAQAGAGNEEQFAEVIAKVEERFNARINILEKENTELRNQLKRQEFEQFCESLITEGKLLPAEREFVIKDLMTKFKMSTVAEFAESNLLEETKQALLARPKRELFTESLVPSGSSGASATYDLTTQDGHNTLAVKAQALAKEKSINFTEAVQILISDGGI